MMNFIILEVKLIFIINKFFEARKDLEKAKSINGISEEGKNKIEKLLEISKE